MSRLWEIEGWDRGAKVRRKEWNRDAFDTFEGSSTAISLLALRADDWELYEEPKKKRIVKMWPALHLHHGDSYFITNGIFPTIEDARHQAPLAIRLATEYPAIEVEVEE